MSDDKPKRPRGNPNWTKGKSGNISGISKAEAAHRHDGWGSALSGIGNASYDKRLSHSFTSPSLGYTEIIELWRGDDIAKRAIEFVPNECFREGFEIVIGEENKHDDLKEQIEQRLKELNVSKIVKRAMCVERALGGSAILLGANDSQALDTPFDVERVSSLDWLTVLEPMELQPYQYYTDPSQPKYGMPEYYQLSSVNVSSMTGTSGAVAGQRAVPETKTHLIHESRLIVLPGTRVSRFQTNVSSLGAYWGDSILIYLVDILRDFNVAWQAAGLIATDFSQPVFGIENLMSIVAKNPKGLQARMQALEMARSVARAILIDTKETFKRETTNISGLPDLLDRLSNRLSLAIDLPLPFLLGAQSRNIGDNGDSDVRMFYDKIGSMQDQEVSPLLEKIVQIVMRTVGKKRLPKKWNIRFKPLWQMTDTEMAEARLTQARSDELALKYGVLYPDEVRKSRYKGEYSFETQIDENKEAPGYAALMPKGVMGAGSDPGAGGTATSVANTHAVGGYARRNPVKDAEDGDDDTARYDYIEKQGDKWAVMSSEGEVLGEFDTRKEAVKRLGEIEYFKAHPEE